MYQHIVVVGNVGKDPEMRSTQSGDSVTHFTLATNKRWTNRDGQPQEKTTWFNVSVFGRQAEIVHQYVTKGRMVLVEGEMDSHVYTAQDGTPRASLDIRASTVRFLGGRGEVDGMDGAPAGTGSGERRASGRSGPRPTTDPDVFPGPGDDSGLAERPDEIPF